jgi:DNA-binding NarL/FixJ family response regulator
MRALPDILTPAEERVYRLVGLGLSNKEIAKALFRAEATVRSHMKQIYSKLGIICECGDHSGRVPLALESYKAHWASPNRFAAAIELLKLRGGAEMNAEAIEILMREGAT